MFERNRTVVLDFDGEVEKSGLLLVGFYFQFEKPAVPSKVESPLGPIIHLASDPHEDVVLKPIV